MCKITLINYAKRRDGRIEPVADETMAEAFDQTTAEVETGEDGLWVGDAIRFFLDAKRTGGRSERMIDDYRKKLELFSALGCRALRRY